MGTLAKKVPNESERKPSAYLTQNVSKRSIAEYIKVQRATTRRTLYIGFIQGYHYCVPFCLNGVLN